MDKCIIFVRVSTERQSYDEQTNRLRYLASMDGYPTETQILIDYKESGIRLKEEERLGLTEMKEIISSDSSVKAVYAFEISRIARSKKVLFSIQDFLVSRKIQLIIAEPYIRMLDSDGNINDTADFSFTLYAQYAESEMRIKQERFRNGRERAAKLGHWHGGRCLFGFAIKDKKMVPDEKTAYIVRRCFEMYASGQSQAYIAQYLSEFGLKRKGYNLFKMLNNPKYIELVGLELYDDVQRSKASRQSVPKYRIYAPGEQLIKCPECGRHYIRITNCYICLGRTKAFKDCQSGFSLPAKYVDAFLLMFSKYTYASRLAVERKDDEERIRKMLDEIPQKMEAENILHRKLEQKKLRTVEVYTDGTIDRQTYEQRLREIDRQIKRSDDNSTNLAVRQTALRTALNDILEGRRTIDATIDAITASSQREVYEVVHREVQEVIPYREGRYKYMRVKMKSGFDNLVRFSGQGISFKAEMQVNDIWLDYSDLSKFT